MCRPAVAEEPLVLIKRGAVSAQLRTASRDGTTHIDLEPFDSLPRLAALLLPSKTFRIFFSTESRVPIGFIIESLVALRLGMTVFRRVARSIGSA